MAGLRVAPFARWMLVLPVSIVAIYAIVPRLFAIPDEPEGHALSHGLPAIVSAIVAVGIMASGAARRRGERLALGALAVLTVAQLLEAASAFTEYPSSGLLHDSTSIVSMLSILAIVGGIVWALADAVRARAISPWYALAIIGLLGALFIRMVLGI